MRNFFARHWRGLTGDWRYPAALAVLIFAIVFGAQQYQSYTDANDTSSLARFAIRQNDELQTQLEALNAGNTCRSQLAVDVDTTKGQVILLEGQQGSVFGQMVVALANQDRAGLEAQIARLNVVSNLLDEASRNYQEALDRRARTAELCTDAADGGS